MARVPRIDPEKLNPQHKAIYDRIAGVRDGAVGGPFAIWMHTPRLAERADQFGNALRLEGRIDKRLFELIVLITARHWSAQYEWFAHEQAALRAGLAPATVEALRAGRAPEFAREDERTVFELVTELYQSRTLGQQTYERALGILGLEVLIEAITAAGFYTMAAMMINAFDAPVPDGARPLP